jgi:hypothetical protein
MADAGQREIDWGSAEFRDGTLLVELTGNAGKAWNRRFEGVLALLGQGNSAWGKIKLTKKAIEVAAIEQGAEGDLRHLLESVVLQVNTHFEADTDSNSESEDDAAHEADANQARDEQITATFRAFAERKS